ncbi:hypothetical protein ACLOJK_012559 [Asimina triloba]
MEISSSENTLEAGSGKSEYPLASFPISLISCGKGNPIKYVLGKSKMILGLCEGIPTMSRGEVAMSCLNQSKLLDWESDTRPVDQLNIQSDMSVCNGSRFGVTRVTLKFFV